jgi:hypothetical protein
LRLKIFLLTCALAGELKLEVPEFVTLDQDLENKSVALNVQDMTAIKQKEMWGMSYSSLLRASDFT